MTAVADRQRHDLVRAVDQILWAWPHAVLDAESRGFGNGNGGGGSSGADHADPTSSAALAGLDQRPGSLSDALIQARAEIWLHAWADLVRIVCRYWALPVPVWQPDPVRHTLHQVIDAHGLRPADRTVLYRLADQALAWWPPQPTVTKGRTRLKVGPDDDGLCGLCQLPAPAGRDFDTGQLLARTIDGVRYHATAREGQACWWIVWRQRRKASA